MNEDNGIVDKERNPFMSDYWVTHERRGLTDNPDESKNLRRKFRKLLDLDESAIRNGFKRNDGVYVAFVAIRWGFAEMIDGKLTKTEKWDKIYLYDDHGQLINQSSTKEYSNFNLEPPPQKFTPLKNKTSVSSEIHRDELIKILRTLQPKPLIEEYRSKNKLNRKTPTELLDFTFGSNIYRAFSHETPTIRFKKWRWYKNSVELNKKINALTSQKDHDKLLFELAQSLVQDWGPLTNQNKPTRMNIGVALKITNLILKHFAFSLVSYDLVKIEWLHVPWDSFTLLPLRGIWTGNPAIPATASQGFVRSLEQYKQLHSLITEVSTAAGVPRIAYEFWAWDKEH